MKLKVILIDDEPLAINVLNSFASQVKDIEVCATFGNAIDALSYLQKNTVDLIFLDVDMPILDGLSFIKSLHQKPNIILTTAHEKYALQGYELEVLDYIVKPVSFPRFLLAINKAIKQSYQQKPETSTGNKDYLFVKIDKKKMKKIFLDEILAVESLKDYIKIITPTQKYIIHQTLSSFTEQLPKDKFIRIHRLYTISIDKVTVVEGNSIEIGGTRYTIGRSYLNEVKSTILDINFIYEEDDIEEKEN